MVKLQKVGALPLWQTLPVEWNHPQWVSRSQVRALAASQSLWWCTGLSPSVPSFSTWSSEGSSVLKAAVWATMRLRSWISSKVVALTPSLLIFFPVCCAGKEDEWLKKERGIGAWHFISFQRIIALFTTFLVIISTVSLAINLSHEDKEKSLLHRTASSNLPKGDAKVWYNVLSTFFIPWAAFALLQRLRRSVGLLKPDTSSYGTTLMLEPPNMSKEQLRSHFASRFPNCTLKSVDFGFSTQVVMQGTLSNIDFHSRVLKVLAVRGEEPPTCCQNLLARR